MHVPDGTQPYRCAREAVQRNFVESRAFTGAYKGQAGRSRGVLAGCIFGVNRIWGAKAAKTITTKEAGCHNHSAQPYKSDIVLAPYSNLNMTFQKWRQHSSGVPPTCI